VPPLPDFEVPEPKYMAPELPEDDEPEPMSKNPEFPDDAVPVLKTTAPLTPAVPEFAVLSNKEPLLENAFEPVMILTRPPDKLEVVPPD